MATNIATAYVAIVPTVEGIQGNLMRQLVPAAGAAGDQAGAHAGKRMGGKFSTAFKGAAAGAVAGLGAAFGAQAIVGQMKEVVREAGNLQQSAGAVNAVFKQGAPQVAAWARGAAKSLGLSADEYNQAASLLGSQLKNAGTDMDELGPKTDKLIGLGADLASMFGGTTSDAVGALSSALKGERDPIEKYGVSLRQSTIDAKAAALGFEKVDGALSAEANAAATLALIMEQTTDAHGNFAREANTYQGQVARLGAQWDNLQAMLGTMFLPILTRIVTFIGERAVPGIERLVGGGRAMWYAFQDARQGMIDVTSSGFAGWMEKAGNVAGTLVKFLQDNRNAISAIVIVVGSAAIAWRVTTAAQAAYLAVTVGIPKALAAARASMLAMNAAMRANPIGIVITALAALVAGLVIAYNRVGWFRDFVDGAWSRVKVVTDGLRAWFVGQFVPAFRNAVTAVGNVVSWLWKNVVQPAWNGIRVVIAVQWAIVKTIFDAIMWAIRRVLAPVFEWLWRNIIRPVFGWITDRISAFSRWFGGSLVPAVRLALQIAGGVFRWLYDAIVRPVFGRMWDRISAVWSWIRDRVFSPMTGWLRDKLGPAFQTGVDAISRAWDRVKRVASAPVKFVIDTVINRGFIRNFNTVARKFGIGTIPEISTRGFHSGGIIPGRDPGNRDNMLVPMRSGEGVLTPEAVRMLGGAAFVHRANHAAAFGRGSAAPGVGVYGGPSSFNGGLQRGVFRSGVMNVSGGAPGYDLTGAINMLDRATRVRVKRGTGARGGMFPNTVHVRAGHFPAWWAGLYAGEGDNIYLNNAVTGNMGMAARRVLVAHELGHALGLPHSARMHGGNGAWSMMNYDNMYRHNSVTPADVAALSAIYGGSGFASGGGSSPEDDKPGLIRRIVEGVLKRIGFDNLLGQIPGGGFMLELMKKAANTAFDGLKSWIPKALDKINPLDDILGKIRGLFGAGPAGAGAPVTTFDGGGWLEQSAGPILAWHRQKKPDAVLANEDWQAIHAAARNGMDRRGGVEIGALYAFDADDTVRKMRAAEAQREALFNV